MSRWLKLLAIVGLIVVLLTVIVPVVFAHHPIVEVFATCRENGKYLITTVVTNSETMNGTNRYMVIDQVQGGPFSGFGVGTVVLAQGNPPNPVFSVGSVTGTREVNGNFSGEYEVRVRVDFQGSGPDNVWGEDSVTLDGACGQQLNLSHIECTGIGQTVEVHFVNVNGADEDFVTNYGQVDYTLNGVPHTAAFDGHTGGAMHYREQLPAVDGVYTVSAASLTYTTTVGTYTVPLHNPGSVTITGCERQNSVQFTSQDTCEGWEVLVNASSNDYSVVGGPLSGVFSGWDPVVVIGSIEFSVGQPRSFPFEFTFVKAEECQQNSASATSSQTCEGWQAAVLHSDGGQVTGAISGVWDENGQATYSIDVTFAHGVPLTFHFEETLTRDEDCRENNVGFEGDADCEGYEIFVYPSSQDYSVVGGPLTGPFPPGEFFVHAEGSVEFAIGQPRSFPFAFDFVRPEECQENWASHDPSETCEYWDLNVSHSEGGQVTGTTSGVWDESGVVNYHVVVSFAHGLPATFEFTGTLTRDEICNPTETPTPTHTPTNTPEFTPTPSNTPEFTPTNTPEMTSTPVFTPTLPPQRGGQCNAWVTGTSIVPGWYPAQWQNGSYLATSVSVEHKLEDGVMITQVVVFFNDGEYNGNLDGSSLTFIDGALNTITINIDMYDRVPACYIEGIEYPEDPGDPVVASQPDWVEYCSPLALGWDPFCELADGVNPNEIVGVTSMQTYGPGFVFGAGGVPFQVPAGCEYYLPTNPDPTAPVILEYRGQQLVRMPAAEYQVAEPSYCTVDYINDTVRAVAGSTVWTMALSYGVSPDNLGEALRQWIEMYDDTFVVHAVNYRVPIGWGDL